MPEIKENLNAETSKEILDSRMEQNTEAMVETELRHKVDGLTDLRETKQRVPAEIKSWLEQIEVDPIIRKVVNDDSGQPVLTPSPPQNVKVVLPATRTTFLDGFLKKMDDAGLWFSRFILRLIKKKKGNVKFKEE